MAFTYSDRCCRFLKVNWCTIMKNVILRSVKEEGMILQKIKWRKANRIGYIWRRHCLLNRIVEGKKEEDIEGTKRRGRICRQLLNNLKKTRSYWKLKVKALCVISLDRTPWRTRFGRSYGRVCLWCVRSWFSDKDMTLRTEEGCFVFQQRQRISLSSNYPDWLWGP
jgi:hypothetical protein